MKILAHLFSWNLLKENNEKSREAGKVSVRAAMCPEFAALELQSMQWLEGQGSG